MLRSSKLLAIVGDPEDLTAAYVGWVARRGNHEVVQLDEARLGQTWSFRYDDAVDSGALTYDGREIPLTELSAFVRMHPRPGLPVARLSEDSRSFVLEERRAALHRFLLALEERVMNRPTGGRENGSKPLQMHRLSVAGFRVPEWLATNELDAARAFSEGSDVVFKSASGLRSQVRRVDRQLLERLAAGTSPVVLQRYVPGDDVRVHVVDNEVFATRISGTGLDYRFAPDGARYAASDVPNEIARLCVSYARAAGLRLAGYDFRVDDAWWCLEMNPLPTFLPYEMETGQPIAQHVVTRLLPPKL